MGIQAFLVALYNILGRPEEDTIPFSFPQPLKPLSVFNVFEITKAQFNADETITIHRNDKAKGHYRKAEGVTSGEPHLVRRVSSSLKVTKRLRANITPDELFVQRGSEMDRYERINWEPGPKYAEAEAEGEGLSKRDRWSA